MGWNEQTIGNCRLICGDAREVLPSLQRVETVIIDPPYGHGWSGIASTSPGGRRWTKRTTCSLMGYDTVFDPLPWLTVGHQHIFWGANHYTPTLPISGGWLIWDKRDGPTSNNFSDCEMAWTDLNGSARLFRYLWNGLCRAGEIGEHYHPNQKPIALLRWCLEQTTGVTIDGYMGSGTTGVACVQLGRSFIGIEIEPRYFDTACQRIEAAYAQPDLFLPVAPAPHQLALGVT